jgi:hypothetical protein
VFGELLPSLGIRRLSSVNLKKICQSEKRIACGGLFVNGSGRNEQSL